MLTTAMLSGHSWAQTETDDETIAAIVNGEAIPLVLVNDAVSSVLQGRPVGKQALAQLQAEVLSQLIDRTLIMQLLMRSGEALPATEVTKAMEQVQQQLADQNKSLEDLLKQRKITRQQLQEELAWQMNWQSFLQKNLTDEVLKSYFEKNRAEFDGTQLQVSHIVMRPDGAASPAENERLSGLVGKLREQITTGKMTFEEAARRYSQAPSRLRDGAMGYIPRHGLAVEPFAAAAFKVPKGNLSEPVITPYGVHLLKVTDSRRGSKTWSDAKEQLKAPAAQAIFNQLAEQQRAAAKIEFTGACPHFEPGTKKLAEAPEEK